MKAEARPGKECVTDDELLDFPNKPAIPFIILCPHAEWDRQINLIMLSRQFKVRGVSRLRVADASIMPFITSGNTNAPTMMIAEKAADLILTS